jgi:PAS domain S-box-containing protein
MPGTTATAARYSREPADPYRALFHHLAAGAAHCRLSVDCGQLVVDVLDSNAAFGPMRAALPRLLETLARVRDLGAPETIQLRHDTALLSASLTPVGGDDVMVLIEDATAKDQLEQRLRAALGRFDQVFHGNAAAMVIAHQDDLRILDVNPRWLEMFEATRDEVIGKTPVELGLISESGAHARIVRHRQQLAEGHDGELELHTRGGAGLTVLASARPIELAEGRCTLTTLIDITARKHAEEAFAAAFGASPAGMILVEVGSDQVAAVNDRLLQMTHHTREALVGRRVSDLALVAGPARQDLLAQIEQSGRLNGVEIELMRTDGVGVWTIASTEKITLHGVLHRLSVFTDIAERMRAEAAMRELNLELEHRVLARTRELETSNRDLEAFSASVSHDLRAPLRAIQGFSEILLEDFSAALPDEAKELLSTIRTSGQRLRQLVDDLLAFSRLGRDKLRRSYVELDPLVRSVIDELLVGRQLGDRLELRVLPLGSCHADPSLLRLVWMNLIDNALKYAYNRDRIVIEIGRDARGGELVYYVRDNGVGFDMAHADRLFSVFQRLHADSEFEGTGIGLANVRRLVERHHGRVAATSELGRGSKFEFTLGTEAR